MELHLPKVLLISGNGRDSGKTTLACSLINKFSTQETIIAVKISPHSYENRPSFSIIEEESKNTGKDSSRMLHAGAAKSYFVVSEDKDLPRWLPELQMICSNAFVICESGGLRNYVIPGIFIIVNRDGRTDIKQGTLENMNKAHQWLTFDGATFDPGIERFGISEGKWQITTDYDI
jgi:hypothetical protein